MSFLNPQSVSNIVIKMEKMFVFLSFLMNLCGIGSVVVSSEGGVDLNFGFVMFFRLIFTTRYVR